MRGWVALGFLALAGCGEAPGHQVGVVSGDIYLLDRDGELRPGAAGYVYLIRDSPDHGPEWAELCERQEVERVEWQARWRSESDSLIVNAGVMASIVLEERLELLRAQSRGREQERVGWLAMAALTSSPTGVEARYRVEAPGGDYRLFSSMSLGDSRYFWIVPISLIESDSLVVDLDNNNVIDSDAFTCETNPFRL